MMAFWIFAAVIETALAGFHVSKFLEEPNWISAVLALFWCLMGAWSLYNADRVSEG